MGKSLTNKNMSKKREKENLGLEDALEEIKQRFGESAVMKLDDVKRVHVDSVSTGSVSLDWALGVGGVPRGRVVEIFGAESSGKTTLALHIIAEAQKKGGTCAFIDAEHALDPEYAKKIGVNINNLLISQPDSGEQALEIVETLVRSKEIAVIVVDSVAALTPKTEIEGEMGDQQIGLQARLMSKALRKLSGIVSKTGTIVVFLNQTRMKIGVMFGDPTTTPGGMALKFYSSVRIRLTRIAQIKRKDEIIGSRVRAKVVKNKTAAPFRTVELDIYYNEGISRMADIISIGLKNDIIKKRGSWYEYKENKIGQGLEGAKEFMKENKKIMKELEKEVGKQI